MPETKPFANRIIFKPAMPDQKSARLFTEANAGLILTDKEKQSRLKQQTADLFVVDYLRSMFIENPTGAYFIQHTRATPQEKAFLKKLLGKDEIQHVPYKGDEVDISVQEKWLSFLLGATEILPPDKKLFTTAEINQIKKLHHQYVVGRGFPFTTIFPEKFDIYLKSFHPDKQHSIAVLRKVKNQIGYDSAYSTENIILGTRELSIPNVTTLANTRIEKEKGQFILTECSINTDPIDFSAENNEKNANFACHVLFNTFREYKNEIEVSGEDFQWFKNAYEFICEKNFTVLPNSIKNNLKKDLLISIIAKHEKTDNVRHIYQNLLDPDTMETVKKTDLLHFLKNFDSYASWLTEFNKTYTDKSEHPKTKYEFLESIGVNPVDIEKIKILFDQIECLQMLLQTGKIKQPQIEEKIRVLDDKLVQVTQAAMKEYHACNKSLRKLEEALNRYVPTPDEKTEADIKTKLDNLKDNFYVEITPMRPQKRLAKFEKELSKPDTLTILNKSQSIDLALILKSCFFYISMFHSYSTRGTFKFWLNEEKVVLNKCKEIIATQTKDSTATPTKTHH